MKLMEEPWIRSDGGRRFAAETLKGKDFTPNHYTLTFIIYGFIINYTKINKSMFSQRTLVSSYSDKLN